MFPSLVNCCTIDWFEPWPEDALLSVAENSLADIGNETGILQSMSIVCVAMHRVSIFKYLTTYDIHETNFRV